uniref:Uncharacterized protein n=1 Tax=Myoviridae sp. ctMne5 TaxID=2825089 RepID=A0A8S5TZU2_9CAUD|nr:MAG TPA: hypothetical protein [Myoviridae sp. ctMne5]
MPHLSFWISKPLHIYAIYCVQTYFLYIILTF